MNRAMENKVHCSSKGKKNPKTTQYKDAEKVINFHSSPSVFMTMTE